MALIEQIIKKKQLMQDLTGEDIFIFVI